MFRSILLLIFVLSAGYFATPAEAQSKRSFDVKAYLDRLDRNKNGLLDPDEMKGRSGGFLKGLGFDVSKPVKLQDVVRKISKDRKNAESGKKGEANLKVPGFGVEREVKGVNDFSATVDSESTSAGGIEGRYGKDVASQVEDVLKRYDGNKNGRLDPEEIKKGRWGSPSPGSSDLNRDGYLTKSELAKRYVARKQSGSSNRSSSRDRDNDRSSRDRSSRDRSSRDRSSRDRSSRNRQASSSRRTSDTRSRSSSKPVSTQAATSSSSSERYTSYAKSLINKYDKNKDGKLDKSEMSEMRAKPKSSADANKDGYITVEEFADSLSGKTSSSSSTTADSKKSSSSSKDRGSTRSRTRSGSSRRSVASSFSEGDRNGDGQILMSEFATDWSNEEIEEFDRRDLNGDGVITEEEWTKARSRK